MIEIKFAKPVLVFSDVGCSVTVYAANSKPTGAHIHLKIYFLDGDGETRVLADMPKPLQFQRAVEIAARKMGLAKANPAHVEAVRMLRVVIASNDNHQKNP